jgi:hypothetical protein
VPFNIGIGVNIDTGQVIGPSGPWTPASLPNLTAWFDAQDSATITQATGLVSNWANKKTGGGDASQATSGSRPAYSATGLNTKPAIVGAAGKSLLTSITLAQPFSIAGVAVRRANGASALLTNNGTANGTHTVGAAGLASVTVGNWAQSGSEFWIGPIGEIVICTSALATSDRQKLEGYLAWKWGLQASLAAGHPYLSAAP